MGRYCSDMLVKIINGLFTLLLIQRVLVESQRIKDKYELQLSNTGPVVYGSKIKFWAQLVEAGSSQQPVDEKFFRYEWCNTANGLKESTQDDFNASIHYCFDEFVQPEESTFRMHVSVYDIRDGVPNEKSVAHKTQEFELTEELNGKMRVTQELNHRAIPGSDFYSTHKPVTIKLNLTDIFHNSPEMTFSWYVNDNYRHSSNTSYTNLTIKETGRNVVKVLATTDSAILCDHLTPASKSGTFEQAVILKDPVEIRLINGSSDIPNYNQLNITVAFNGSGPFTVCWWLQTHPKMSRQPQLYCQPLMSEQQYSISIPVQEAGRYGINVSVENPVSLVHKMYHFTVYGKGGKGESVLLPVICGVVAMMVLTAGFAYVVRVKKRKNVEVADFDFHPTIPSRSNYSKLASKLRHTLSNLFGRDKYDETHRSLVGSRRRSLYESIGDIHESL